MTPYEDQLGQISAPYQLVKTLTASPFDAVIIGIFDNTKSSYNDDDSIFAVLEVVPFPFIIDDYKKEGDDTAFYAITECCRNPSNLVEMVPHPILAEYLVLSSISWKQQQDANTNAVSHSSGSGTNSSTTTTTDNNRTIVEIKCCHNDSHILSDCFIAQPIEVKNSSCIITQGDETLKVLARVLYCDEEDDSLIPFNTIKYTESFQRALERSLRNRLVLKKSVVALHVPFPPSDYGVVNENPVVVILLIEDIQMMKSDNTEHDSSSSMLDCFRLCEPESFALVILPDEEKTSLSLSSAVVDDNTSHMQKIDDNLDPYSDSISSSKSASSQTDCPGYEHLLQEIWNLSTIHDRNAAPSAVLLAGCAGVGKTCLASALANRFLHSTASVCSSTTSTTVRNISAREILLVAPSYSSDQDVAKYILGNVLQTLRECNNNNMNSYGSVFSQKNNKEVKSTRVVMIFDDLQVLIDPENTDDTVAGNSSVNVQDSERASALNAIFMAMDILRRADEQIVTMTVNRFNCLAPPPPFILGICRNLGTASHLPTEFLRVNRFEKVFVMSSPTQDQRERILQSLLHCLPISYNDDNNTSQPDESETTKKKKRTATINRWVKALSLNTAGCVAADLRRMCADALIFATSRVHRYQHSTITDENYEQRNDDVDSISSILSKACVTWNDISHAARNCIPSELSLMDVSTPQIFALDDDDDDRSPNNTPSKENDDQRKRFELSWKSFFGYDDMKTRLNRVVVKPWLRPGLEALRPPGVIFYGPSGCGKSLAASCLSSCLSFPVVKVRASDVLDQWLGGSEAAIRSIFARARAAAPCILFFDEIDALTANREEDDDGGGSGVYSRVLSTFLNEMDGISIGNSDTKQDVLIVAATNRLHAVDAALLRPGRLQEHIYIPMPNINDCLEILKNMTKAFPLSSDLDLRDVAKVLHELGASGADIEGVCREACLITIRRTSTEICIDDASVSALDFEDAINRQIKHL